MVVEVALELDELLVELEEELVELELEAEVDDVVEEELPDGDVLVDIVELNEVEDVLPEVGSTEGKIVEVTSNTEIDVTRIT